MTGLLVGLLVGACMGFFGAGAGSITIPLAVFFMHMPYRAAGIAGLVVVLASGLATSINGSRKHLVVYRTALPFLILSTPAALIAAHLSKNISNRTSALLLAGLLVSASVVFWRRHQEVEAKHDIVRGSIGAIAAGTTAGVLGVGAGFVAVPSLRLASGLPIAKAVATSSLMLWINALAALIVRRSEINWTHSLGLLALASVGGAIVAGNFSHRVPSKLRHRGLSLLLLGFAVVTVFDVLVA
ncbi:MAG TPA: sulfite exporter TauE/SafE family protein [Candidatus Nanopelagicaceae bacterium]|nr:sulfite exporter TauE/SafE family protein [Candidatus Nanopelagicaceae bacterium]